MEDFGERLLRLRGRTKNAAIAKRALGEDGTSTQRRDFANYLARIERGEVPSPGLKQLEQIARGYGLTLSQFFSQLERRQTNADYSAISPSADKILQGGAPSSLPYDDLPTLLMRLADACSKAAEVTDRANLQGLLDELAVAFVQAAHGAVDGLEEGRRLVLESRKRRRVG